MESVTFKEKTHSELLSVLPVKKDEILAFLSALFRVSGSLEIVKNKMNLVAQLDSNEEGFKIIELLQTIYPAEFELNIGIAKSGPKQGKQVCSLYVPYGFTKQVLFDLYLMKEENGEIGEFIQGVPSELIKTEDEKKAFLQGLYLASGSTYVPSTIREGYHFEFQVEDEVYADEILSLTEELNVSLKKSIRGESFLLYLKDKDTILEMLTILSLSDSAITLQSIMDERETANNLNRAVICETANLDKTYTASAKQLQAIAEISEKLGIDELPQILSEVVDARLEHQTASLQELADILGITKSCLNHRFRKIMEIAENLNKE